MNPKALLGGTILVAAIHSTIFGPAGLLAGPIVALYSFYRTPFLGMSETPAPRKAGRRSPNQCKRDPVVRLWT